MTRCDLIFSVCAPPPPHTHTHTHSSTLCSPVTEHVSLHSKSLCKNMARASGGANNMQPLIWGALTEKILVFLYDKIVTDVNFHCVNPEKNYYFIR